MFIASEHCVMPERRIPAEGVSPEGWATPWVKCLCGGSYLLMQRRGRSPELAHTLPYCERYARIESVEDAIRFSEANRGVS